VTCCETSAGRSEKNVIVWRHIKGVCIRYSQHGAKLALARDEGSAQLWAGGVQLPCVTKSVTYYTTVTQGVIHVCVVGVGDSSTVCLQWPPMTPSTCC
jgi:hypothetical protein